MLGRRGLLHELRLDADPFAQLRGEAHERSGLRSANDALQALDLADEVVDESQRHGYG